jgi:hypothetical protein
LSPIAALEDDFDITIENEILDPTATAGRWRLIEFTGEAAPCSFAGAAGKLRLFCAEDIGIADGESDGGLVSLGQDPHSWSERLGKRSHNNQRRSVRSLRLRGKQPPDPNSQLIGGIVESRRRLFPN